MPTFNPASGPPRNTTPSLEQYVEAVADLLTKDKVCSISEIAERVQVSRPAASRAIRELAEKEYVDHKAYGYVDLTQKGHSLADVLTARHVALYEFLTDILGFDEDWADQEACRLEHQVEDELVARLAKLREFLVADGDTPSRWREWLEKSQ